MTCTLILMRHAKSSWTAAETSDHDRPLNKRGQRSAAALGDWLRDTDHVPDQVLCSSALRAQETYAGLGLGLPAPAVRDLYLADPDTMMALLKQATGRVVLMIGHNPGIADFATRLVRKTPTHDRFHDYPTGATLIATFDVPGWPQVDWGLGTATDFVIPRELTT